MKILLLQLHILFLLMLALLATSCEESEKFSSDPALKIEFSRDTVRFDTVFTTIGSPVQRMKVHNRNNNSISFESIELMNPEKSGYRMNVNGLAGTKLTNVELLRKDSIYIFVDAKLKELNAKPSLVRDSICLKWNGNTKYIQLGAYGIDVHIWDDKVIDANSNLTAEKGYYIKGNVTVNNGVTLTIDEGTNLYFDTKGGLTVNGSVKANGTPAKPITLRGHRFDYIEQNIPYDNASDQWEGIVVGANSFNNEWRNVRIRNARVGMDFIESTPNEQKALLINTVIHNTSEFGLRAINSKIDAINCQISNSRGSLVNLVGGSYSFLHSTIANYYAWHSRTTASVLLEESKGGKKFAFTRCQFVNSLVVGTMRDEVSEFLDDTTPYIFDNCVIQATKEKTSPRYVNTIWNIPSVFLFKELNSTGQFYYSFELLDDSSAKDTANPAYSQMAGTDLRGVSRLADGKPDIGCYEWTSGK